MNRIKELRLEKGCKQAEIASVLKITQATFSGWESGKYEVDNENLHKLADFFDVSIDYLLGRDEPKPPVYDEETLEIMDELRSRPELKMLFKSSTNATREDIEAVANMFDRMNKRND